MTKNLIEYWRNVETNRNNLITEAETKRSNQAKEMETKRNNEATLAEINRHNLITEKQGFQNLQQNRARDEATQKQAILNLQELNRSNLAQEDLSKERNKISASSVSLGYSQLGETIRSNRQNESTNLLSTSSRMFKESEDATIARLKHEQEKIRDRNADEARVREYVEQSRHNLASEKQAKVGNISGIIGNLASTVAGALLRRSKSK